MKVAITTGMVPFRRGPAEERGAALARELERAGHATELVRLPFQLEPFTVLPEQLSMVAQIALGVADRVISLEFPAYLSLHRNQVVWLDERFAPASGDSDPSGLFPDDENGQRVREWVIEADARGLAEARQVFVSTNELQRGLRAERGISAQLLSVPPAGPQAEPAAWSTVVERLVA